MAITFWPKTKPPLIFEGIKTFLFPSSLQILLLHLDLFFKLLIINSSSIDVRCLSQFDCSPVSTHFYLIPVNEGSLKNIERGAL